MRLPAFFLLLFFPCAAFAQRIAGLNLFLNKETVVIKFRVRPGISCNGYTVLHSTDSISYTEIGSDPGICGTSTESEDKSYTHVSPELNKINYYKVRLEPRIETSSSRNVLVTSTRSSAKITAYPNPFYLEDLVTLNIFNVTNARLIGYLCNQFGKPIKLLDLTATSDQVKMPTAGLNNGLYVIWLTDGTRAFTCKFIILR